jgi:hypothetical protein
MEVFPKLKPEKTSDVQPGSCYGFFSDDQFQIGIAIADQKHREPAFIALTPGIKAHQYYPAVRFHADYDVGSIVKFENTRIKLPFRRDHVFTGKDYSANSGTIIMIRGVLGLLAIVDESLSLVYNVEDGLPIGTYRPQFDPCFPAWSIETQDGDGSWKEFIAFDFRGNSG